MSEALEMSSIPSSTKSRRTSAVLAAGLALAVVVAVAAVGYWLLRPQPVPPRPLVRINSPHEGQQVAVGQSMGVDAMARSKARIVRAELWVDGELQEVQASPQPEGAPTLPMLAQWRASTPGAHTLIAQAFDAQGRRSHASVTVEALPSGDRDGDGVADHVDAHPNEADVLPLAVGPLPAGGQSEVSPPPDADGDGVADARDLCPQAAGPAAAGGCPPSGAGDRDGDGVADDVDLAPSEPGLPEHGGSPSPGSGAEGEGIAGGEEAPTSLVGFVGLILRALRLTPGPLPTKDDTLVEVQVVEFRTHQQYDGVVCYACLGDRPEERIVLDRLDGTAWQIPANFGAAGEERLQVDDRQPLTLTVHCGAYRAGEGQGADGTPEGSFGEGGSEEAYFDLGTLTASHTQEDWDGRRLLSQSVSPDASAPGRVFHMIYRLCEGSCDASPFPPPSATLARSPDGMYLSWTWDGDAQQIDGFSIWCYDGQFCRATRWAGKDARSLRVADLAPGCGATYRFWLSAQRNSDGVSSPASNTVLWETDPCPGYLLVDFRSVGSRTRCERGPIYGQFWANEEVLSFDASDRPWGIESMAAGLTIPSRGPGGGCGLEIQEFFDDINGLDPGWVDSYTAPVSSRVCLPMYADSDLTIGVRILEDNPEGADPVLFEGSGTIPASHLLSEDLNRSYGDANSRHRTGDIYFLGWWSDGRPIYSLEHSDGRLTFELAWSGRPQAP